MTQSAQPEVQRQDAETAVVVASQWRLMWWRFKRHRLALISVGMIGLFYFVSAFAEFLGVGDPALASREYHYLRPQPVRFFDDGKLFLHVNGVRGFRDENFKWDFEVLPEEKLPIGLLARGFEYKLFGLISTDRHLIGFSDPEIYKQRPSLFLLGSDKLGRDQLTRLMLATRISTTVALLGVFLSLALGVVIGGISGYYGGAADLIIQRIIEMLVALPTLPLWMALSAAVPNDWSVIKVYFAITIILSIFGWTGLARVVRGRFLTLREEEFVTAARISGAPERRIIFRHMVPSFYSHIIATGTLAIPGMVLGETALSFLGIGMKPPAVSYGVLLQQAQNPQTVALYPWLMMVAIPFILIVLSFNFMGDGLRDASDPYGQ